MQQVYRKPTMATSDRAYLAIREMIFTGDLEPGGKVSQLGLARRLGCSAIPVNEALRRLESDGILDKRPRKIARVRRLSLDDLHGLYLVREGLEAVGARLAAHQINAAQLARLHELNERFEAAYVRADGSDAKRTDVAIHRLIAESAACPLLLEELERLLLIERTAGHVVVFGLGERSTHAGHGRLIQAIADHDSESSELFMKKHIQAGYDEVRRALEDAS